MTRTKLAVLGGVAVVAAGGSYAIAASGAPPPPPAQVLEVVQNGAPSTNAAATRAFESIEKSTGMSLDVKDMRTVDTSSGRYYLAAGPDEVCVHIRSAEIANSASCTTHESLAAGDPMIINDGVGPGTFRVSVLFPDGVSGVALQTDQERRPLNNVSDNLAVAIVRGKPARLTWRSASASPREFDYSR